MSDNEIHLPHHSMSSKPLDLAPIHKSVSNTSQRAHQETQNFQRRASVHLTRKLSGPQGRFDVALTPVFIGVSAVIEGSSAVVAVAVHDETYLLDFAINTVELEEGKDVISNHIINELKNYEQLHMSKIIGAGIPTDLSILCPTLCSRLWLELDTVPIEQANRFRDHKEVDEQADSMARKCIMHFGPSLAPLLQVGYRGTVNIDSDFHAKILSIENFKSTCAPTTWSALSTFVDSLKSHGTKIAFFSSTPQGGGVALMRHALVRLARLLGVDLSWYVPKPKPGVFRITKTIHNILQGVSKPEEKISAEEKNILNCWIEDNANRFWLSKNGPLRPVSEGGADVIVIDDPQMPGLIPLIKRLTPERPVLYRSHIQIRSDLAAKEGSPQADVWEFLWNNIKQADMFISHPIPSFVPENVPRSSVAYLPATTDWLDGLNKDINEWDLGYYSHLYNRQCHSLKMTELKWLAKRYIIQVARFDPAKGIPDVVESYAEFRRLLAKNYPEVDAPQLVICGNGSIDDPDGTIIYDQTMTDLESRFPDLLPSVSVMRLSPNDQLLNTLISSAHIVLQLSTREGFEVKVSEGLHKGKPVIATNCGGIPLQVQHGKNGFLVEAGDWHAVAGHLIDLYTNEVLYAKMSAFAKVSVSDEVGTVGNALAWFYLADEWANGKGIVPSERWVNDLARDKANTPYADGENKLPRF